MLFFSAAAPIFAMARICGAVPGKPTSHGLYRTGSGRSLASNYCVVNKKLYAASL